MAQTNVNTQSGNRVQVEFDGIKIGLIQSVRMADDYSPEPASGIGDIHVQEYVPTMARHTLNVSSMVLKLDNLRKAQIFEENGDGVLRGRVFDFVVYDKDTNRPIRRYLKCSYASGEVDVQKHAIVMSSGVFMCLDVKGIDL
jgi:hypothetical protein